MTAPNTIIETNIERILEDHLWEEVRLLEEKVELLKSEIDTLVQRKEKLISIASAAEIPRP